MKTVEIVKTSKGWFVTRRYCGMNQGREFFFSVAPTDMGKREAKKFLAAAEQAKAKYISEWMDE